MVFEGEPTAKLHAKDVKAGTNTDRNPRQDQVTMGGLTVLDLLTTKALRFVRILYHTLVIAPLLNSSQVPVEGCSNSRSVCWLANNYQ